MIKKVLILTSVVILLTFVGAAYFLYSISRSFKKLNQGVLSSEFVTDTIPFRYSCSGHILIDVKVNEGKSFSSFILDSGASNIVFKRFSEEMSFENNGFTLSQGAAENWFLGHIKSIQFGKIAFDNLNAKEIVFDGECQENICGIIGIGVMHHFVWQIDFERQQIIVAKRPDDLEFGSNYFEIPLNENKKSHHLRTKVRFGENRPLKSVLVDLGSNSTLFLSERDVLNDSIKYLSKGILGQASKGLGEEDSVITYRYYKTDSLFFNNSDFAVSDVTVCTASKSLNLLGLGFFENYKTTINWPDKKLILEPVHPNSGFIGKTKGFSLIYNKDKSVAEIGALVENTAASKANFKLKTQVIAINEISLLNYESYCRYRNTDLSNDTIEVTFKGEDGSKRIVRLLEEPIFD